MITLLCSLALLIGIYCAVQRTNKKESVSKTEGTIALTDKTQEDLQKIAWTKDKTDYAFIQKDGVWSSANEPECPVKQESIQELADKLINLQASGKLENVKELADYGLKTAAFTVTTNWTDGSVTTYSMGDATPFADGFYLTLSGNDNTVYTIPKSLESIFNKTKKDLVQMEEIPNVQNAIQLSIGNTLNAVKKDESLTSDPAQLWYDASADIPLDGTQVEMLITKASKITWKELVSTKAKEKELTDWKLDEASAVKIALSAKDGNSRTLLIGSQNDAGAYYARLPESLMVYAVDKEQLESLLSASVDTLWCRSVLPISYENLSKAEFITEKSSYTLEKPLEKQEDEGADKEKPETETAADPDEKEKDDPSETLEKLWSLVTSLKATERLDTAKSGNQILTIHAVTTDGRETTAVITDYSVDSYQAVVDGGSPILVPAENIDLLVRTVRSMQ